MPTTTIRRGPSRPTPPPAGAGPDLTRTQTLVVTTLTGRPGATAAILAGAAGIGFSTAGKALAALEKLGMVTRTPGGHLHGRRRPDTWKPCPRAPRTPTGGPRRRTPPTPVPPPTVRPPAVARAATADLPDRRPVTDPPGGRQELAPPAREQPPRTLARGELPGIVREHLARYPHTVFTPYQVGQALRRSAGACTKVLIACVARGEVRQVCDRPRQFQTLADQTTGPPASGTRGQPPPAERRPSRRTAPHARRAS